MSKKTAKNLFKDKTNVYVSECLSTNDFLTQLAKKNDLFEGSSVITDYQTQGRGQRKNKWESKKGENLLFSILMKPDIPLNDQFKLHMITSLSIRETLTNLGLKNVKIKWPNDIYVNDKKISGILIESQIFRKKIKQTIIGVGLNVNQKKFSDIKATSISNQIGKEFNLKMLFNLLKTSIENGFQSIQQNIDTLVAMYQINLYKLNSIQDFTHNNKLFEGKVVGVSNGGSIIIEVNGKKQKFDFGSVRFI